MATTRPRIGVNVKVKTRTTTKLGRCPNCRKRNVLLADGLRYPVRLGYDAFMKGRLEIVISFFCRDCGIEGTTVLSADRFTAKTTAYTTQIVYGRGKTK